jgi:hypothetical protein
MVTRGGQMLVTLGEVIVEEFVEELVVRFRLRN